MDNLTHSLAGAVLGQMGLKKKTGLAMPTLIIAANIPDIDAFAVLLGGHQHLAIRRGLTHGPIAMVILPLLLWAVMLWFDRWQERRGKRPEKRLPVHKGWLLALAYIGCLSHPALDWLNSYGVRLLEPFSSLWFYGDSIFIIDIWIWIALIAGVWLSLRRERRGQSNWQRPAFVAFTALIAYVMTNIGISNHAENVTRVALSKRIDEGSVTTVVANPVPVAFWQREILFGNPNDYYRSDYSLFYPDAVLNNSKPLFIQKDAPPVLDYDRLKAKDEDVSAFLFWSRLPYDAVVSENGRRYAVIGDARFTSPLVSDRFMVKVQLDDEEEDGDASP